VSEAIKQLAVPTPTQINIFLAFGWTPPPRDHRPSKKAWEGGKLHFRDRLDCGRGAKFSGGKNNGEP